MFRRKKKAANKIRQIDPAMPPVVANIPRDYFDLSPEERRDFLRGVLGGMSPNPEVRAQAEETRRKFVERGKYDPRG